MSDFETLNNFVGIGSLRNYQKKLLSGQALFHESDREVRPVFTFVDNDFIAYLLNNESRSWLICKSIQFGFPAVEIRDFRLETIEKRVLEQPLNKVQVESNIKRMLENLNFDELYKIKLADHEAKIYFGHINFAHVIWNELPALLELIDSTEISPTVQYRYDPIDILSNLKGIKPQYLEDQGIISSLQPIVRVGSNFINAKTIEFIKGIIPEVKKNDRFTIWVTVRNDGRTCINQSDFIIELIKYLVKNIELPMEVIFDGFNFPVDFSSASYDARRENFSSRALEIENYIENLIEELSNNKTTNGRDVVFSHTCSMTLVECLGLTKSVDYYVSHVGSIQHKVSWVFNPPGFIHGNSISVTEGAKKWLSNLTENIDRTFFISDKFISDVDSIRLESVVNRNKDYKILYNNAMFAEIFDHLKSSCKEV